PALAEWLEARRPLPARVAALARRYANEPYRLALALVAADLERASRDDMTARLLDDAPHRARVTVGEVRTALDLIAEAMPAALAEDGLRIARAQLEIFGLHTARLDVREESSRLAAALGQMLEGLGIARGFVGQDERERQALVLRLLDGAPPEPSDLDAAAGGEASAETWRLFKLLARARTIYGGESTGPFVISMTRGVADVLTVLVLARWAGAAPGLQIAPLFETLDDLAAAPGVLAELFALDVYREHLAGCP